MFTSIASLFHVWVIWTGASKGKKKQKNTCSFSSPQPKANPGLWAVHLFLVLTGLAPRDQNYRYQEKGNGIRGSLTRPRLIKTERSSLLMKRRSAPQAHNLVNKENSQKVHCVGVHIFFFFFSICFVYAHVPRLFALDSLLCIWAACLCVSVSSTRIKKKICWSVFVLRVFSAIQNVEC